VNTQRRTTAAIIIHRATTAIHTITTITERTIATTIGAGTDTGTVTITRTFPVGVAETESITINLEHIIWHIRPSHTAISSHGRSLT